MDEEFDRLIELQRIDSEIKKVQFLLDSIPSRVQALNHRVESSTQTLNQARERLALNQKKRRELEGEVKDIKSHVSKYKLQLNQVKTNKEYQALLKEIDDNQRKIDKIEEEIIGELLNADQIEADIVKATEHDHEEKERLHKEKELLSREKARLEEEIRTLRGAKQELLPHIPREQVALYQRIFDKKDAVALSPVTDDFCTLCHMRIRPQMLSELMEKNSLILCENCGRILYWVAERTDTEKDVPPSR